MASVSDEKIAAERTILISDVPATLDEILEVYLESPKTGGGNILSFKHDPDTRTAVVTFDTIEVASHFLSAGQICVMDHVMPISSASSLRTIYVLDVPDNMVRVLELFLGNSKKGGGDIERFTYDPNTRAAQVVFAETSVAAHLCQQGYVDISKHRLVVSKARRSEDVNIYDHIDDDAQSTTDVEKLSRSIFIEDVPPDMVDFLELHLESKKFGGGVLEEFTPKPGGVLAVFEDAKVAGHLLDVGEVNFAGTALRVMKPDQRLLQAESFDNYPDENDEDDDDDSIVEISSTVLVKGIPPSMSEDILRLFLENKRRSGGGDIAEIDFDAKLRTAVVAFEDSQVTQSMLSKGSVRFNETTVLEFLKPPDASTNSGSAKIKTTDVLISGISGISQEKLKMFLENTRRSGGGKVVDLQYDGDDHAVVHFEDDKIAEEMISKGQVKYMDGRMLTVEPASPTRSLPSRVTRQQSAAQPPVPRCTAPRTIEVTGFQKANVSLETLRLYFESKNRSGGGDVDDFQLIPSGNAVVTFKNSEDALRVAKKPSGHSLSQATLSVRLLQSWPTSVSCAVKVTGFSANTTDHELTMLFENKNRSGGGSVKEVHFDGKNSTAVITFDKHDDAVSVVQRQPPPSLRNCTLSVEAVLPACPPPFMDNESHMLRDTFIFAFFPVDVKSNTVREFARRAVEVVVKDVKFSCMRPGHAMITYATNPDYSRLMWSLCSWPCHGQMLSLERVAVPRSIQVFNFGDITKENLELYFESPRANGGEIRRIEIPPKLGCAIVEFADAQVADQVLTKDNHTLSNRTLHVSVYYDEFGVLPPDFDCSLPCVEIPEDVDAKCIPEIVEFVRANKQLRSKIEEQLKKLHCVLKWPRKFGDQLVFHCTVSSLQPGAYFLVRGWADKCGDVISREFAGLQLCSVSVLHEIWQPLKDAAAKGKTYAPEEMLIHWEDETSTLHFCGFQTQVGRFQNDINKIKDGLEEDLRKRKAEVTEETKMKSFQAALLAKSDFVSVHNSLKITTSAGAVVFVGQSGEVQSAKIDMLKLLSGIANCILTRKSIGFALLLDKEVMKKRIDAKLSRKKLVATYEVGGDGDVKVYAFSQKELDEAVAVIKAELVEKKLEGGPGCQTLLLSTEWKQFKSDLIKKQTPASISEDGSCIIIVSISDEISQIESKVQDYISANVAETQFIPLAPGIVDVLKNHAPREVNRLEDKIKVYGANILIFDHGGRFGCEITSVRRRMPEVTGEVHAVARLVICKPYKVQQQSHVKYLCSSIGRSSVDHVALKFHVSIKFPEEMRVGRAPRLSSHRLCDPYPCAEVNLSYGKTIRLVIGDITRHQVDVIVNAANAQLQHGSGVAGAISRVGGPDIGRECDEFMKSHGRDLACGEIFKSTPGRLPCKAVIHTVGPVWHGGNQSEEKDLAKAVTGALTGCSGYKTVALPAISCGIFHFPRDLAVKIIVAETRGFLERSNSSVNRVDIISGDRPLIDEFKKMLSATFGSSKITDLRSTSSAANTGDGDYEEIDDDTGDNGNNNDNDGGPGDHGDTDNDNSENENGDEGTAEDNEPSSDYESIANDDIKDDDEEGSRSSRSDSSQPAATSFKTAEGIAVNFVKGSLVTMKADVIFSSVSKNLDMTKGVVAKLIATSAGSGLLTECRTKWPSGIDYGQVIKTSSHGLQTCRSIHFGAVRKWDGRHAAACEKALRQLVKSSLTLAATDGERTIAFPSVGTGYLSFPADCVAKSMLDEVVSFSQTSGAGSITDVYFVIHDRDRTTLDAFQKEFNARASGRSTSFNATGDRDERGERGDGYRSYRGRGQHYHRGHRGHSSRHYNQSHETPPAKPRQSAGGRGKQLRCTLGDIAFCVRPGNIVAQNCDAIVNSTNEKLDLSVGALSKAIVAAGGSIIQQECNSGAGVKHGMAVTAAGSLPSQFIFHLAPKRDISSWKAVIGRCLKEAESMKLKSIVMPPLGTGRTGVGSVQEMAAVVFTEVSSFAQSKPSHLRSISVVLHEPTMIDDFIAAVEQAEKDEAHPVRKFFGKMKDKLEKLVTFIVGSDDSDSDGSKKQHQSSQKKKFLSKSSKTSRDIRAPSKLMLHIYGMVPGQIDGAIRGLEDLCTSARKTHPLNDQLTKTFLEKMTPEQEDKLKSLVRRHEAVIHIDRTGLSMVLEGDSDNIAEIVGHIYQYMVKEKEKSFAEREAKLFAKQAVWQYREGSRFKSFGEHTIALLEKSFQEKKPAADWTNKTGQNRVTFKDMKFTSGDGKTYVVRRFEPGKINLPPLWAPMKPTDVYLAVSISSGSEEYKLVEKSLLATAGGSVKSVTKIERIQNPGLYKQYMTMKLEMDKVNGHQPSNERRLWHGTAGSNTTNISSRNFNRNYGGVHGLAIGNGVYFATGSSYSIQGYCPVDTNGHKYIYQARVLTGKFTTGQGGLREPPAGYNSVANSTSTPSMFVVFYDAQTYPEYLITFT